MNVTPSDWQTLNRLLDAALSLPAADRPSWLEHLQGEDPAFKPLLFELLTRTDLSDQSGFLSTLPRLSGSAQRNTAAAGDLVGPYRLLKELGSGGMGSVWLAERAAGPPQPRVAIKLPLGAGTSAVLTERFARERNILAALEHPNIARLYDTGVSADGRPYLALEYIEGEPIDVYCRKHELDIRSRLGLILQVCAAVAHVHTHLTIHRDLKPANIQVDANGQIHLLDFGVATLLCQRVAEPAALTPDYASPEQVRGEAASIASDVYSLGVVMYELLAGKRPYESRRARLLSVAEAIAAAHPKPPSEVTHDPARCRALRGDLDAIVLKALKKVPAERHATVNELAEDIRRYLSRKRRPSPAIYRRQRPACTRTRAAAIVRSNASQCLRDFQNRVR